MTVLGEFQFATWSPRSVSSLITNYRASEHWTGTNLKKSKKTNRPPSGLLQGWDCNLNKSQPETAVTSAALFAGKNVVGAEDASDHDSMVQYGGFLLRMGKMMKLSKLPCARVPSTWRAGLERKPWCIQVFFFQIYLDQSQYSWVSSRLRTQSQQSNWPRRKLEMAISNGALLTSLLELTSCLLIM